ncbi:LruC domain-containing protein [Bacteroides sp.]
MKTMLWVMCSLVSGALTFTSCVDDEKDLSQPGEKTSDLNIPDNTDWTTTRSITLSITSPVATQVELYTDAACTDENLLAKVNVSDNAQKEIQLDVAKADQTLYLQYPTNTGKEVMNIPLNTTSTRAENTIKLPENVSGDITIGGDYGYTYKWYPSKGREATLMFEDNWPEIGDYDFNDFVIWYHTQGMSFDNGDGTKDSYDSDGVEVKVTFRALGGYLPYRLGLQLDKTPAKYIDDVVILEGNDLVKMELQNPGEDDPAIFIFTGTDQLRKQTNGGAFYNTDPAHKIAATDLVTIKYKLKINCFNSLKKSAALWEAASSENQNFFLQKESNGGREIHLRGYEPTKYYSNSYVKEAGSNMKNDIKYCSTGNLVWGIKVPVAIAHPIEKMDIIQAYGLFKSWITQPNTSDPSQPDYNENWFKENDPTKVI